MAIAANWSGVLAWFGGLVFIPSLALALGTLARSHRLFQGVYLMLWYAAVSRAQVFDCLGVVRVDGHPAGPNPLLFVAIAFGLLAVTFGADEVRHARR